MQTTSALVISDYINLNDWNNLSSSEKTMVYKGFLKLEQAKEKRRAKYGEFKPVLPMVENSATVKGGNINKPGAFLKHYKGNNIRIHSAEKPPKSRFEALRDRLPYWVPLNQNIRQYLRIDELKSLFNSEIKLDYFGQAMDETLFPLWFYYSKQVTGNHYFERLNSELDLTTMETASAESIDLNDKNKVHLNFYETGAKNAVSANVLFSEGQSIELDNRRALYRQDIASACAFRYAESRAKGFDYFRSLTYAILGGRELWNIITNRRKLATIPLDYAIELQSAESIVDAIGAVNSLIESGLNKAELTLLCEVLKPENYSHNGKLIWLRVDNALSFGRGKSKRHFKKLIPKMRKSLIKGFGFELINSALG